MRVLLVEDDPDTSAYIVKGLEEEGHTIDHLADGCDGLARAMADDYDVLIIDRMLPGQEGLQIVKSLRRAGRKAPILFLTALGGVDDRVVGMQVCENGASDTPRLKAMLRKAMTEHQGEETSPSAPEPEAA